VIRMSPQHWRKLDNREIEERPPRVPAMLVDMPSHQSLNR
jgi:hypothetical protein